MRVAAFCDFYADATRPLQLILSTWPGELDWSKMLYIPVSGPFEPFAPEDFGDLPGVSVLLEDLVLPKKQKPPEPSGGDDWPIGSNNTALHIGINLPQIAARCGDAGEIGLLVVQMDDVEEVLGFVRR